MRMIRKMVCMLMVMHFLALPGICGDSILFRGRDK